MRKEHVTDVLVIGSGGAGLRAAIEAKKAGVNVTLVSKSPIGLANSTSYSIGRFRGAFQGLTKKKHFKMTVEGGRFINNEKLVDILVKEAPTRLLELKEFGVTLDTVTGYCSCDGPPMRRGEGLTRPLKIEMERLGVKIIDKITIIDLLGEGGAITGAVGLNLSGDALLFGAKAIILATGGAGQLYLRNDNPIGTVGDGCGLALRVGAELMDMEFVQFFPLGLSESGLPSYLFLLPLGVLRNSHRDNFLERHGLDLARAIIENRDYLTRAIWSEIQEGRGDKGAVLLDLTEVSEKELERSVWFKEMGRKLLRDFNYREKPVHVAPLVHYFMGGIRINERCETNIPGLYAAGEAASGVHGANRIGGNALTDTIVFGSRAGLYAAEYAMSTRRLEIDTSLIKEKKRELNKYFKKKPSDKGDPYKIKSRIQSLMWQFLGIGRTETGLKMGIERLNEIKNEASDRLFVKNSRDLKEIFEVFNMLNTAVTIAQSAKYRTESRGSHYRIDFPRQDKNWLKNVLVSINKKGRLELRTQPVNKIKY